MHSNVFHTVLMIYIKIKILPLHVTQDQENRLAAVVINNQHKTIISLRYERLAWLA